MTLRLKQTSDAPMKNVWLGTEGDDVCGWRIVGFAIRVLHDRLVSDLLDALA